MKHFLLRGLSCLLTLALGQGIASAQSVPNPPVNLQSSVQGNNVTLTWETSDIGDETLSTGFEDDVFPPEGWSLKVTDVTDPYFTWFHYPAPQYLETNNYRDFILNGEHSAFLQFDLLIPRPAGEGSAHQDEWLISPVLKGTAYLVFNFYINPMLLENGQYDEFPNDYPVMVSRDGGETWEEVWNARYDMLNVDGWQQAVVCLGEPCDNMKVAFAGISDPDDDEFGLFYSWAIDDVAFYADQPAAEPRAIKGKKVPAYARDSRPFDTTGLKPSPRCVERRMKSAAASKAPLSLFYNVYRDGQLLGSNIHALTFVDEDGKPEGTYTYEVRAVNAEGESEPATIKVAIGKLAFAMPRNLQVSSTFDEDKRLYEIHATWEAPESEFQPSHYIVYTDGQLAALVPAEESYEFHQTEVDAGTYKVEVEANYANPEGASDRLAGWITVGQRSTVTGVSANIEGNLVSLSWGEPTDPDRDDLECYIVYRANDLLADNLTTTTFEDDVEYGGLYRYTVLCKYNDGTVSAPKHVDTAVGEVKPVKLPSYENFDGKYLPANWQSTTYEGQTPDEYIFRFDNPYEIEVDGDGFEGGFASAENTQNPFVVAAYLTSPIYDLTDVNRDLINLKFAYDFLGTGQSRVFLQYSNDRGQTWEELTSLIYYTEQDLAMSGNFCMPQWFEFNFSDLATGDDIMFRLYYESYWDKHIAVDSWSVYAETSGVESAAADAIRIKMNGNVAEVSAPEDIILVEAYDTTGRKVAEVNPQGASTASLELPENMVVIVKAVTTSATKTVKATSL